MRRAIRRGLWLLARLVVPLRYRIRVHGWERVRGLKGPVLLLPNHPGYIDPVLVLTYFYGVFRPRPVLYEENFRSPVLRPLVKLLRAVPIPELDRPSREAIECAEQAVSEVIEGLRRGENFVLWPAGRVQRDGVERLGGAGADRHSAGRPRRGRRPGADPRRLGQQLHLRPDEAYASARAVLPERAALAGGEPAVLHAAPAR